jgi:hypothetical protein
MAVSVAWRAGAPGGAGLVSMAELDEGGGAVIWVINARCASYTMPGGSEGTNDAMRRLRIARANFGDVEEEGNVTAKWAWRSVRWWRSDRSEGC